MYAAELVDAGAQEHYHLGRRFAYRFPNVFPEDYRPEHTVIQTTIVPRCGPCISSTQGTNFYPVLLRARMRLLTVLLENVGVISVRITIRLIGTSVCPLLSIEEMSSLLSDGHRQFSQSESLDNTLRFFKNCQNYLDVPLATQTFLQF